jgi:hypothetical protein
LSNGGRQNRQALGVGAWNRSTAAAEFARPRQSIRGDEANCASQLIGAIITMDGAASPIVV